MTRAESLRRGVPLLGDQKKKKTTAIVSLCDHLLQSVENIDADRDLELFVKAHSSGESPPPLVLIDEKKLRDAQIAAAVRLMVFVHSHCVGDETSS